MRCASTNSTKSGANDVGRRYRQTGLDVHEPIQNREESKKKNWGQTPLIRDFARDDEALGSELFFVERCAVRCEVGYGTAPFRRTGLKTLP